MSVKNEVFLLPSGDDKTTLENIIAPEFFWTSASLYDCLSDIFSYIDAYPILKEDNTLSFVYLNDLDSNRVNESDFTNYKSKITTDKYANTFVSNYQNGRIDHTIIYPSANNFARVKGTNVGVPDAESYAIFTNKPIDYIEHLYLNLNGTSIGLPFAYKTYENGVCQDTEVQYDSPVRDITLRNELFDLSHIIFEESVYSKLKKPADMSTSGYGDNQYSTMHFTQGSNIIEYCLLGKVWNLFEYDNLGNIIGNALQHQIGVINDAPYYTITPNFTFAELRYRVEFKPQVEGIAKVESPQNKIEMDNRVSQSNGGVLLSKMGANSIGNIVISGNEERTVVKKIADFSARYKIGDYLLEDNDYWIVNKSSTTFYEDFCIQTLQLTKNFNKLSQFIRLDRQKRFSEISKSLVAKSEDYYTEYVYISPKALTIGQDKIHLSHYYILTNIEKTLTYELGGVDIDLIGIRGYDYDQTAITSYFISIPFVKYGCGNTINFEMSFEDSKSAGTRLTEGNEEFYGSKYFTEYVIYADTFGFMDYVDIDFLHSEEREQSYNDALPQIDNILVEVNKWGAFDKLKYLKRPNEIFAFNYQLCFLGYDCKSTFIGQEFIRNNAFVNKDYNETLYLYITSSEQYSILDRKCKGTKIEIEFTGQVGDYFEINTTAYTCNAWAIGNANGDLYFAFNTPLSNETPKLYFYASTTRKD